MSDESTTRRTRETRPGLEGLEDRRLLSGAMNRHGKWENLIIHDKDLSRFQIQKNFPVDVDDRRISYAAPGGGRVTVTLYGKGTLAGSTVDPDGVLDLRFANTDEQSGIVGMVHGGTGRAPLGSLLHSTLPPDSVSGIGSSVLRVVNLRNFDLLDGGRVNLTGGVKTFLLNSTGRDTQVSLRELPEELLAEDAPNSTTQSGVTFGFAVDVFGARTLTSTSGEFIPGAETFAGAPGATETTEGDPVTPPGLVAVINQVNGPSRAEQGLGSPVFFGYDPDTNELIGFAVSTDGADVVANPSLRIANALPVANPEAGVSMSRYNGDLVVLLNDGTNVYAFDPLDGSKVGEFSLINKVKDNNGNDITIIDLTGWSRLGTVDSFTVIGKAGTVDVNGDLVTSGELRFIDVTRSIDSDSKMVMPLGDAFPADPYVPGQGFGLSGGYGSVPGSSTLFAAGGARFDTFLPDQYQLGGLSLAPVTKTNSQTQKTSVTLSETARAQVGNVATNSTGGTAASPNNALGSLQQYLALITGLETEGGKTYNEVSLLAPTSSADRGMVKLYNPNLLSGLTSAFYPDLDGLALIDVQGNVQSFRALSTRGMVFNDTGTLNLVKIHRAEDSTVIGYPISHVEIANRNNVELISTTRPDHVEGRGGVTIQPDRRPTGPLSLP